jgi:hypothetical protein
LYRYLPLLHLQQNLQQNFSEKLNSRGSLQRPVPASLAALEVPTRVIDSQKPRVGAR